MMYIGVFLLLNTQYFLAHHVYIHWDIYTLLSYMRITASLICIVPSYIHILTYVTHILHYVHIVEGAR